MATLTDEKSRPSSSNRDITDRLLYPLLYKLVAFIPRSVHPNVITLAAILCALLAAAALGLSSSPASLLACAALLVMWIILDSFDGIHARNTGQSSTLGGFLDHFGDAVGMFCLQAAIIFRFDITEPVVFCALLLRQALAACTYIIQVHAGKLYIPSLGWSFEIYAYAALMVVTFFFPNVHFQLGHLPAMNLTSNVLLVYYVAVPMTLLETGLVILNAHRRGRA
jgi:phosphatidylglycerophosphate synthase